MVMERFEIKRPGWLWFWVILAGAFLMLMLI